MADAGDLGELSTQNQETLWVNSAKFGETLARNGAGNPEPSFLPVIKMNSYALIVML
jgi:hypothetical protein